MPQPATVLQVPDHTFHVDVKNMLREAIYRPGGAICPTCTQHSQVYRWSLYSTAAQALILFYRIGGINDFVHSNQLKDHGYRGQGDAARLRMWELVEREAEARDDGGRSGYWRVTPHGERFVRGTGTIHRYAFIYAGRVLHFDGDQVTIHDALGKRFSYDEIMGWG